tara:strand:+ start:5141 stop:5365 length:225 start_codon:yes stop_codon:yes gene_type:complete
VDNNKVTNIFFDMINQEDWSEEVFTGTKEDLTSLTQDDVVVAKQFLTLPTPHPHFFINLTFEYEYNPELGKDLW